MSLCFTSQGYGQQTTAISNGLQWLTSAQQQDGSWGDWSAPLLRNTASVAETFQIFNQSSPAYTSALQWLTTAGSANNDYVARRLKVFSKTSNDTSADLNFLLSARKSDGGWGLDPENESGILNTALALQALKAANYTDANILYQAVNYLTMNQNSDGGWGFRPATGAILGDDSNTYVTAIVLRTLAAYDSTFNIKDSILKAKTYLLSKQNPDGGFGSSPSTIYETALSIISLTESGQGSSTALQNGINYLTTTQAANGSWNDDPYSTALALQSLANVKPNLSLATTDITFSKTMPQTGESITITAVIKNTGLENASDVIVRFYYGDPTSGGTQIGSDQTIALIALGSSSTASVTTVFTGTGNRSIFAVADPDNLISETTKVDNKASAQLWVATVADLAVFSSDLKPSTYTPASGAAFTLQYSVRNLGESATGAFDVAVYDGTPSGTPIQTAHVSGIGGTEVRTGTFGITLTGDGPHTLYVVADPGNAITETTKTNNTGSVTVQVGGSQTGADLVISSADITLVPSRPHAGDTVAIVARVRNQGTQPADNFTIEMFDGAPDQGGTLIYTQTLSLAAGGQQSVTGGYTIASGIHDIYVILDRINGIIESDESNNKTSVRVMTDMVDISLSATDLVFNPSRPVAGDTVALSITAHNQGIANTGPFNLALYDGDPKSGGSLLQVFPIQNIPGDGSVTTIYTFTAQPRTYRFYAVADPDNFITEMYKDNNQAIRSLKIKAPGEVLGPDLVPVKIDLTDTTTDPQTLAISGTARVTLQNKGDDKITQPFDVLIFEDKDGDAGYTAGVDNLISTATNTMTLWPEGANIVDVPLAGTVKFLHAPLYALIDSSDSILEQSETNNLLVSCKNCENKPANPIQPVVKWQRTDIKGTMPIVTPLTDTNGDGKADDKDVPALVFQYGGGLYAWRGDTGATIWHYDDTATNPALSGLLAAGDFDRDGFPELVTSRNRNGAGSLVKIDHNANLIWDNAAAVYAWGWSSTSIRSNSYPMIVDLMHDGKPEIIVGNTVVDGVDGSIKWSGLNFASEIKKSIVADLNLDGNPAIIVENQAYNADGTLRWRNTSIPPNHGFHAVGRFDDDPYPEVVLESGTSISPMIYLLDHNGNILWGPVNVNTSNWGVFSQPVIADVEGDGEAEILIKGADYLFAYDKHGNMKHSYHIPGNLYVDLNYTPTVFDLNGDGNPEVLISANSYFRIFDGKSGTLLYEEPTYLGGYGWGVENHIQQHVIVADVDGDGQAEIVVSGYYGVKVYGSRNHDWVGSRKIWTQDDYHVTNVNDDGSIPQYEAPSWLTNNTYRTQAAIGSAPNPYLTPNITASLLRVDQNATTVNLTVRVGNGGAIAAPAGVNVTFYDGDPAANVVIGMTATTKILQPGEYQDIMLSTTTLTLGLHHIYAVVNSGTTAITECRTDDNQTFMDFTVQEGSADLKIGPEDIALPAAPYYEGSVIPITASVKNIGSVTANNVTARLYLGSPTSGGVQIGATRTISNIDAAGSSNVIFNFDTLGRTGTNVLYIVLDQENSIIESSETNNMAAITITVQTPELPNLTITTDGIQMSSSSIQEGQAITITTSVANRGAAVGNIPVKIVVSSQESGVSKEVYSETKTIYPILSLGQTATVTATLNTTGLSGQQTVFVAIDPANTIIEFSKTDNTATKSFFIESAGLSSSVVLDKTAYQRDETLTAAVVISNSTGTTRSLFLNLSVKDTVGNTIAVISAEEPVTVNPNSSAAITKTWSIGSTLTGNYILATEITENSRVVSKANASFVIAADKSLEAKVTVDKISYKPNETATVTSTITSKSPNYIFENLTAKMTIAGSGGQGVVFTETKPITMLMPGAGFTFRSYWNTGTNPAGTYPVTIEVRDATNAVIATGTQSLVITSDVKPSDLLRGQIALDRQVLLSGETATVSYSITNVGNTDLSGVSIFIKTVSVNEQTVYDTLSDTTSLLKGASYTNTKLINTTQYGAKDYLVVLRANISGTEDTLTGTYLRIEGAPTAPSLNSPADGSDVLTFTPELIVNNASDPNDDKINYEFELYSDSGLTRLEASSGRLTEGTGITTWSMPYSLTENQTYYWRARAFDGWLYGPWTAAASFRVNTVNESPTAPVLLSPTDGGIVSTLTPTLTITNASDPDSASLTYNFDVALDPDFTRIVVSGIGIAGGQGTTAWQVSVNLVENMTYYWRAQADDWFIIGPWSTTSRFFVNTVNNAPTVPVVISPVSNAVITSLTTDITVQNSTDLDSSVITYFFEADIAPAFDSSGVIRSEAVAQGQGTTTWSVQGLRDNTRYYVRAKASDGQADSMWSGVITFFANTVNDPPSAPAIANPSSGSGVSTNTPTLSVQNATDPDGDLLTYEFALYADSGMTALVASAQGIPETLGTTSWTVPAALVENQNYYWKARAFDGSLYSVWMTAASFMVNAANDAPGAPTILSPLDNGSVGTLNPVLTIANAVDPESNSLTYEFEVYKDGTLVSQVVNVPQNSTGTTSITLTTSLTNNTVYQWRARAFDGDRYGPWTPLSTFTMHLPQTSITVDIDFEPETLNKSSHGHWVKVEIELPHGYYAKDVDISSIRLEGTVLAELRPYEHHRHHHEHGCDHDRHGHDHETLMVKFRRSDVIVVLPVGQHVPVHVTGMVGTTQFGGVDVIKVKE